MTRFLLLALMLGASSAHAEGVTCSQLADTAALIMKARQAGVRQSDIRDAMDALAAKHQGSKDIHELSLLFVQTAYAEPLYSSPEYKERAVLEFRDEVENECYAARDKE